MNEMIKINWKEALKKYLPKTIYTAVSSIDNDIVDQIEEIRLRISKPLMIYTSFEGYCVNEEGLLSKEKGMTVSSADIEQTFSAITGKSPYAYEDEISQGFLTLSSGIRVGLAGSAILNNGAVKTYKSVSGINFRIPREVLGISKKLLPYISKERRLINTLIISAPKLGKTTLVRDISRCAGNGINLLACKVSLIDERCELAASLYGRPLFDVGRQTDVLSNIKKHTGVFMALRSLSPDVIMTDEIGKSADLEALREIANSGVVMITTAHAPNFASLLQRLFFKKIFEERLFEAYVVLSAALGRITIEQIHDDFGQEMIDKPFLL